MVMQEQARRLREPLSWGRRERSIVGAVLAIVIAVAIALIAFAASSGAPARADCIDLTFPSTLGGAEIHGCGTHARKLCASGAYKVIADDMRTACTKAGFAFREPPQ